MKTPRLTPVWSALILAGLFLTQLVSAAPLPNAWQISDNSTTAGVRYTVDLSGTDQIAATNSGFTFSVNARFVSDWGAKAMTIIYGLGNRRFLVWWDLDGNGDLTAELEGDSTYTLTTNGTGASLYHTHAIVYNPANGTASYLVDGQPLTTNWPGSATAFTAGQVFWGSGSSTGQGQMNFHSVQFDISGLSTAAQYEAGTEGNPVSAPNPTNSAFGWTLAPSPPPTNTAILAISPDYAVQPAAVTPVILGSLAWGDYDNDGRLDLLNTGTTPSGNVAEIWRNSGDGTFSNVTATAAPALPGVYYSSVAWGDSDNDGDLDFLLTGFGVSSAVSQIWQNRGDGTFSNVTATVAPGLPGVFEGAVAWADYDNDGRLDFLITGAPTSGGAAAISQIWRNQGDGTFSNVTTSAAPALPRVWRSAVAWGDVDNDGHLDFLITGQDRNGNLVAQIWHNSGSSAFYNLNPLTGVEFAAVAAGDHDNDGFLDYLIVGTQTPSLPTTTIWHNSGDATFADLTTTAAPGLPDVREGSVAWGDYDNDGRLDFLITGQDISQNPIAQIWRNKGNGTFSNATDTVAPSLPGVTFSSGAWADYDNDGRLDFILSGAGINGGVTSLLWHNYPATTNAPPTAPSGLAASVVSSNVVLTWDSATDDHTPAARLTYNVRLGTTAGGSDIIGPQAELSGFRLLPAPGNTQSKKSRVLTLPLGTYYWSVQAVDSAFAGGSFAPEQPFRIAAPVAGDINSDGVVDQTEFNTILNNYWQTSPPNMESVVSPGDTVFQFGLTNLSSLNFHVLATTNVAEPLMNWQDIGPATLHYEFTDPDATNYPARFYQLIWP